MLNATLKEVCARLREADIHPILLKGQGVALCYRYPEQRQCGDIDLYICPGDYEKACSVVRDFGQKTGEESESIQHYHFTLFLLHLSTLFQKYFIFFKLFFCFSFTLPLVFTSFLKKD